MCKDKDCKCDRSKSCVHSNKCVHVDKLNVECETNTNTLNCCKEAKVGSLCCSGEAKVGSLCCDGEASMKCLDCCEKAKVGRLECSGKATIASLECSGLAKVQSLETDDASACNLNVVNLATVESLQCCGDACTESLRVRGNARCKFLIVEKNTATRDLFVTDVANVGNLNVNGVGTFGDVFYPNAWGQISTDVSLATSALVNNTWYLVPVTSILPDINMQSFSATPLVNRLTYTGMPSRFVKTNTTATVAYSTGAGPSSTFQLALFLNGVGPVTGTIVGLSESSATNPVNSTAITKILELNTTDYIDLRIRRISGIDDVVVTFNMTAVALPNCIAAPI